MADELWSVRLPSGVVKRGTLDELDAAFQAGHIDENVLVLPPNGTAWTRLGELAGIDEGGEAGAHGHAQTQAFAQAPARAYATPPSLRPVAREIDDRTYYRAAGRPWAGILIGLVAVGGLATLAIVAVVRMGGATTDALPTTAAAAPVMTATAAPAETASAEPAPPRLTDEQKKTILDNDAKRQKEQDARKKARDEAAAAAARRHQRGAQTNSYGVAPRHGGSCGCQPGDPLCACN
jgi:hypothetical protein